MRVNNLKDVSSITSVFNLSQSVDRHQDKCKSSRLRKESVLYDIEQKLDALKHLDDSCEAPDYQEGMLQCDRLKSSLQNYLRDKNSEKL